MESARAFNAHQVALISVSLVPDTNRSDRTTNKGPVYCCLPSNFNQIILLGGRGNRWGVRNLRKVSVLQFQELESKLYQRECQCGKGVVHGKGKKIKLAHLI